MTERYFDINNPGYSIKCKIYCDKIREVEHVIVFFHGFGGHKDNKTAARFAESALAKMKKTALLTFDLPCHGSDVRKKISLFECRTYMEMVLEYVQKEMQVSDICAYATSFGGYLTLRYISEHGNPFRKIALRCPALNMYEAMGAKILTGENLELLEKGKEALAGFDRKVKITMDFLEELKQEDVRKLEFLDFADDILIIHGTKDEIIPMEISKQFAEDNVIEFLPVDHADHRFSDLNQLKLAHSYIVDFYLNKI